jgi:hypothetical protein
MFRKYCGTKMLIRRLSQGAVDNDAGGRSYSLEGAMVLLPQYAPYTDPLGVLICGGSTPSGHYALDNCVSTQPEADTPVWTIERMVRVVLPSYRSRLANFC